MKYKNKQLVRRNYRPYVIIAIVAVMLFGAGGMLFINRNHQIKPAASTDDRATTTSTAPTAQENFTDGDDRVSVSPDRNEGTVEDLEGEADGSSNSGQFPIVSTDGKINVLQPQNSTVLLSGDVIQGTSTYSVVNFRLIDNISGVISTGSLKVVNGRFAGEFSFSTSATEGRLDVFYSQADGTEASNIEIPVKFR